MVEVGWVVVPVVVEVVVVVVLELDGLVGAVELTVTVTVAVKTLAMACCTAGGMTATIALTAA